MTKVVERAIEIVKKWNDKSLEDTGMAFFAVITDGEDVYLQLSEVTMWTLEGWDKDLDALEDQMWSGVVEHFQELRDVVDAVSKLPD